jgi:hypothetical protein
MTGVGRADRVARVRDGRAWPASVVLQRQSRANTADKLRGARARRDAHDDSGTAVTTDYHASLPLQRRLVSFIRLFDCM